MEHIYCGVRNLPTYTTMIRTQLGWDRQKLGRILGLSAREVYYIELGQKPKRQVVNTLKTLEKLQPYISFFNTIRSKLVTFRSKVIGKIYPIYYAITGRIYKDQLTLGCCRKRNWEGISKPLKLFNKIYASVILYILVILLGVS